MSDDGGHAIQLPHGSGDSLAGVVPERQGRGSPHERYGEPTLRNHLLAERG